MDGCNEEGKIADVGRLFISIRSQLKLAPFAPSQDGHAQHSAAQPSTGSVRLDCGLPWCGDSTSLDTERTAMQVQPQQYRVRRRPIVITPL